MTRIQLIVILVFVLSFCISCKPDPPIASFISDKTTILEGETIHFTDKSLNEPTRWTWTFEGGLPATSASQNPTVIYNSAGIYSVILEVANDGGTDMMVMNDYITVKLPTTDISFSNNTQTEITISILGESKNVLPEGTTTFYDVEGYSAEYYAQTFGKTSGGTRLGLIIFWNDQIMLNGSSMHFNLNVSPKTFFLFMRNSGTATLGPITVNYGLVDRRTEFVELPPDGIRYSMGYYPAYTNSQVRAFFTNDITKYVYWNLSLPFTENQVANLVNTNKKKSFIDYNHHIDIIPNPSELLIAEPIDNISTIEINESIISVYETGVK